MNIEELKNKFQAVAIANSGIETFLFDDLSTINTNRQKKYMVALMKTPNSVMTPFKHTDFEANWENYAITIYFLRPWTNEDKKTVSLEQRYREIEDVANGYIKEVLAEGSNEYALIGDKSVTKTRGHHQHVDQLVGLQYDFTLRVYVSLCPEVGRAENLTATTISSSQIDLAWVDNSTNESGFEVWRSINCSDWVLITTTAADVITYSDTGLAVNSAFAYRVRAVSGSLVGVYSNIAIENTESGSTPQTGIAYCGIQITGEVIDYRTGADGYRFINGDYVNTNPLFPIHYAELDTTALNPFMTLIDNNVHGNKDRFTDSVGGQNADGTGGSLIDVWTDHYRNRDYYIADFGTNYSWDDVIDGAIASSAGGFNDWFSVNLKEIESLINEGTMNYFPFNTTASFWTSTTRRTNTLQAFTMAGSSGINGVSTKTNVNRKRLFTRKHF